LELQLQHGPSLGAIDGWLVVLAVPIFKNDGLRQREG